MSAVKMVRSLNVFTNNYLVFMPSFLIDEFPLKNSQNYTETIIF